MRSCPSRNSYALIEKPLPDFFEGTLLKVAWIGVHLGLDMYINFC
jgi:hypothetical protein